MRIPANAHPTRRSNFMATTKRKTPPEGGTPQTVAAAPAPAPAPRAVVEKPRNVAAYEAAVAEFATATEDVTKGRYAEALPRFKGIAARMSDDEPILADRSRTFASICARRLESPPAATDDPDQLFHRAVYASNSGRFDEALSLLEKALVTRPNDASIFYARASVRGLQGNVDGAAGELRRAVALDPHLRYQAASDPDFERVRDEAAFIDVIEPTGTGA
jgi:tetratricopeptide (TPR) repeat protein